MSTYTVVTCTYSYRAARQLYKSLQCHIVLNQSVLMVATHRDCQDCCEMQQLISAAGRGYPVEPKSDLPTDVRPCLPMPWSWRRRCMEWDPGTCGHTHPDCGACDAVHAASSGRSQSQVPSVDGRSQLQPTSASIVTIKTKLQLTNAAKH